VKRRMDSRIKSPMPRPAAMPGGWVEALEGRQLFTAPLCGPAAPSGPLTPPTPPPPVVQQPTPSQPDNPAPTPTPRKRHGWRNAVPQTAPAFPPLQQLTGTYTGPFGSLIGSDGGAFTINILSGANGSYDATFAYEGGGRELSVPGKLTMTADGKFTMRYFSAKVVVQVNGTINAAIGRITGDFQIWGRTGNYRAAFTLTKR